MANNQASADHPLTIGMGDPCTWSDVEDWLSDAIGDSIDLDWTPRIAAELIVRRMKDGDFPVEFFPPADA